MRSQLGLVSRFGLSAGACLLAQMASSTSFAADAPQTVAALRIAGMITDGALPPTDPAFQQMLAAVTSGDYLGAATIAAGTRQFASTLARRLSLQMQNPDLDYTASKDSDATLFLQAHFAGYGAIKPSISNKYGVSALRQ